MTHAPVPTPPSMPTNYGTPPQGRVRPSAWWYALVPIIFLVGIGFGVAGAVEEGRSVADSFSTLGSDGTGSIELEQGREATVMAVWDDGRSTDGIARPPATVTVTGPDDTPVTFDAAGSSQSTFSVDSKSGIDLGTFTAERTGTHEVRVTFDTGAGSEAVPTAAVGRLDLGGIAGRILRPIGWGALASIGLFIALLLLRGSSKRRRNASPQYQGTTPNTGGTNPSTGPFV